MPHAVVTGAAGFIGCHLVESLHRDGYRITAIDNLRSGDWNRVSVPCDRMTASLETLTETDFDRLCGDADVVFHLAAEKHNSAKATPQRIIDVNVSATERLFAAAARAQKPKVVFTSSLYAYGSMGPHDMVESDIVRPHTVYGMSKVAGEHLLNVQRETAALRWAVARLFFVFGPRQFAEGGYKSVIVSNFERMLRGEAPTIYGDGEQSLDYVYIDDVVEALRLLALPQHDGMTVNVASGRANTVNDLTTAMMRVSGVEYEPIRQAADWTAGSRRVGGTEHASGVLGWNATTPLEDGLSKSWQSLQVGGNG